MIHVVAHADLEDIKHLRREFCLEAMRGEGAQGDAQESGDRAGDKEKTIHEYLISGSRSAAQGFTYSG